MERLGIHDLKSLSSTGRRPIPLSAKSAFLDLYMRQSERDRITKEKMKLKKRKEQINKSLAVIDKRMARLLKVAIADNKRPSEMKESGAKSGKHTVLEF